MKLSAKMIISFVLALMSVPTIVSAETVTILPFQGESIHPQIRSAARDALGIFLTDNGMDVRGNEVKAAIARREKASEAAKAAGAGSYIEGRITRLGNRAIVQVQKFDVGSAQAIYSDRMTAASPSDLETVMRRLAKSLATGKKAAVNEDIRTVTEREEEALRRRVANNYFGITLGGSADLSHSTGFMPGFGLTWLWDNRNVLLSADWTLHGLGSTSTGWSISIGGYYPFSQTDTTMYVGGGLALSGLQTERAKKDDEYRYDDQYTDEKSGMSVFVAGGALIGRTSTVSIRPEVGYMIGTYNLNNKLVHGPRFGITLGF